MAAHVILSPDSAEVSAGRLELGGERDGFGATACARDVDAEDSQGEAPFSSQSGSEAWTVGSPNRRLSTLRSWTGSTAKSARRRVPDVIRGLPLAELPAHHSGSTKRNTHIMNRWTEWEKAGMAVTTRRSHAYQKAVSLVLAVPWKRCTRPLSRA